MPTAVPSNNDDDDDDDDDGDDEAASAGAGMQVWTHHLGHSDRHHRAIPPGFDSSSMQAVRLSFTDPFRRLSHCPCGLAVC